MNSFSLLVSSGFALFFLKETSQEMCAFVEGEGQIFWQAGQDTVTFIFSHAALWNNKLADKMKY